MWPMWAMFGAFQGESLAHASKERVLQSKATSAVASALAFALNWCPCGLESREEKEGKGPLKRT